MNRRDMLKTMALALAGAAVLPSALAGDTELEGRPGFTELVPLPATEEPLLFMSIGFYENRAMYVDYIEAFQHDEDGSRMRIVHSTTIPSFEDGVIFTPPPRLYTMEMLRFQWHEHLEKEGLTRHIYCLGEAQPLMELHPGLFGQWRYIP